MATPEQNTLLALQLFGAPAAQLNSQNDARTNLLLKLAVMNREEQLKRDLAAQGYDKAIELANLQAGREDARWKTTAEREDARGKATEARQASQLTAMQAREDTRAAAADTKALRNQIAKDYPKYAAAATQLGEEVRAIGDFDETWEGLGDLQAEMARLEQTRVKRDQELASEAAVGELDDAVAMVADQKKGLAALMKTSPDDEKFARARAVEAVRTALETGGITGAPKPNSTAAKNGLSALSRGDVAEASKLLGSEVLSQFEGAYQTAIQAAPNFKSRMQQLSIAQQNYQLAQRNLATIQSDLRKAAAGNNALATRLTSRRSALQEMMSTPDEAEAPRRRRTFEELTPAPGAASPAAAAPARIPSPEPAGALRRGTSALLDIGRSELETRAPGILPAADAIGGAFGASSRAAGNALTSIGSNILHPVDALVAYLEEEAARRRAQQQLAGPDQVIIGPGPN